MGRVNASNSLSEESRPPICSGALVLFGATSGIAVAVAAECLRIGQPVILVGRSETGLKRISDDLEVRYQKRPPHFIWDLEDKTGHADRMRALLQAHEVGGLLLCAGLLHEEEAIRGHVEWARDVIDINLTESIQVLLHFAAHLRGRREGVLAALSSVAGDRGRAKNATYGAAKAGLAVFLAGLRLSLREHGVGVCIIKPGPVRTRMTAHYQGPRLLLAEPEKVAKTMVRALRRQKTVTYVPGYWKWVMAVFRWLPEPIFARMKA
jgi:decaprenylphospho-beta-D-erythro-pentofuranosid-2-ulose 2-reductase